MATGRHDDHQRAGEYRFDGLAPGDYRVMKFSPAGYYDGGERVGTAGGMLDGIDTIHSIDLEPGMNAMQYDFCEKVGVMLSGNVYHDRDNDGIFDRGPEEGIAGVVVKLLDGSGNDTGLRATTNAAGFYKFNNLAAGTYAVMEIHPAGWLDGIDTPGNLGGVADVSPPGDMISQIMINWGQMGIEYNFGELLPGSIRRHRGRFDRSGLRTARRRAADRRRADRPARCERQCDRHDDDRRQRRILVHRPAARHVQRSRASAGRLFRLRRPRRHGRRHAAHAQLARRHRCRLRSRICSSTISARSRRRRFRVTCSSTGRRSSPTTRSRRNRSRQLRDGRRTPDDQLLAGVVLELRQGASGDPIFVDQALPGHYAGAPDDPIRVVTDATGFYQFTGLRAGTYAVVEHSPEGVIDGVDTAGTLGGFAGESEPPDRPTIQPTMRSPIPTPSSRRRSSCSARSSATMPSCGSRSPRASIRRRTISAK